MTVSVLGGCDQLPLRCKERPLVVRFDAFLFCREVRPLFCNRAFHQNDEK